MKILLWSSEERDMSDPVTELLEIEHLWLTSDPEIPLYEFLRLTKDEFVAYAEGRLSAAEVLAKYHKK